VGTQEDRELALGFLASRDLGASDMVDLLCTTAASFLEVEKEAREGRGGPDDQHQYDRYYKEKRTARSTITNKTNLDRLINEAPSQILYRARDNGGEDERVRGTPVDAKAHEILNSVSSSVAAGLCSPNPWLLVAAVSA
jgi:hypothetical protein